MPVTNSIRPSGIYQFLLAVAFTVFSCSNPEDKYKPSDYFTEGQEKSILMQLVLKTSPKPEGYFTQPEIEAYYQEQAMTYRWHFAHDRNGSFYFLISRPAPSLYEKRMAIGGVFSTPDNLHIKGFKEVFRTFKMKPEVLVKKSSVLFEKMVNGSDLEPYYPTGKQGNEEWIEFPDALNYYDSSSQSWKTRLPSGT